MSYTQGKLSIKECGQGSEIVNEQGEDITEFLNGAFVDDDARRLVACWNACNGIPTEEIESGTAGFLHRYATVVDEREALVKERDELISILRRTVKYANRKPFNLTKEIDAVLTKYPESS